MAVGLAATLVGKKKINAQEILLIGLKDQDKRTQSLVELLHRMCRGRCTRVRHLISHSTRQAMLDQLSVSVAYLAVSVKAHPYCYWALPGPVTMGCVFKGKVACAMLDRGS